MTEYKMKNNPILLITLFLVVSLTGVFKESYAGERIGNPIIPGYFADPTIKKFGDTFYLYATTDGEKLASGQPTVWISKDFINWYNYELDIEVPEGLTNCWAPDVVQGTDGNYYYYMGNCQFGCNIYGYMSESPMGPWKPINDGKPVIPVGTGKEDLPALDAQFLQDDDGSLYNYFGTWCTSFGGVGWAKVSNKDMSTIESSGLIPISQVPYDFEANFPLKRNGKYILMYSSGDCRLSSYAVHYAWADNPTGLFKYGKNNPILSNNSDGTVDSPGHHSVLKDGDNYYIIYHRHDNPHSTGGMFRQLCADKMVFENDTTIEKIKPTHNGIGLLGKNQVPFKDLAFGTSAKASSSYKLIAESNKFNPSGIDYEFKPEYVTDNDNGTLWKASSSKFPQSIIVDLGKKVTIRRIMTQFEHSTYFYQYKLEVSADGTSWNVFSDKTANRTSGSPMIDDNSAEARYVRLTITGTEKQGMFAAVWNLKVYDMLFDVPLFKNVEVTNSISVESTESKLIDLNCNKGKVGKKVDGIKNQGTLGGKFIATGNPIITLTEGVKAIQFDGNSELTLSKNAPQSLSWNSPYTFSAWVYNPTIEFGECLMVWCSRENMLMNSYAAMTYGNGPYGAVAHGDGYTDLPFKKVPSGGQWHHIAVTFDGMLENVYVDGKLDTQLPINLFVESDKIHIGASGEPSENFTGSIANLQLYDKTLTSDQVIKLMTETNPK